MGHCCTSERGSHSSVGLGFRSIDSSAKNTTTVSLHKRWWMPRDHRVCLNAAPWDSTSAKESVQLLLQQTASVHLLTRARERLWAGALKWNTKDSGWKKRGKKKTEGGRHKIKLKRKVKKLLVRNWVGQSGCKCHKCTKTWQKRKSCREKKRMNR